MSLHIFGLLRSLAFKPRGRSLCAAKKYVNINWNMLFSG